MLLKAEARLGDFHWLGRQLFEIADSAASEISIASQAIGLHAEICELMLLFAENYHFF